MITRYNDWPERLATFIEERRDLPFAWNGNDCCSFAMDWLAVATGHRRDLPEYDDAASAARQIKLAGGIATWVTEGLGDPIDWRMARRGDIALVELDGRKGLAVVAPGGLVAPGERHLIVAPLSWAVQAWAVGY